MSRFLRRFWLPLVLVLLLLSPVSETLKIVIVAPITAYYLRRFMRANGFTWISILRFGGRRDY